MNCSGIILLFCFTGYSHSIHIVFTISHSIGVVNHCNGSVLFYLYWEKANSLPIGEVLRMLYPLDKTSSNSFAYYLSISNLNWSKEYLARS